MGISIQYAPNAQLVGQAAFDAGYGDFARQEAARRLQEAQLAEQARQFDERQALTKEEFATNKEFQSKQAEREDYLKRYQIQQHGADAAAQQANQLAAADMQGQYGLAREAMQGQIGLQQAQMQQVGQNQRSGNEMERARWELINRDMLADEMNIQRNIASGQLDADQIDSAWQQHIQKYSNMNAPVVPGMQPPPPAPWEDREQIWQGDNAYYDKMGLPRSVPDERGMPSRRGMPQFMQTPQGMELQHGHKMEENAAKDSSKSELAIQQMKIKQDTAIQMLKLKQTDAELTMQQKSDAHQLDQEMSAHKLNQPKPDYFTSGVDALGKPKVNQAAFDAAVQNWLAEGESIYNKVISLRAKRTGDVGAGSGTQLPLGATGGPQPAGETMDFSDVTFSSPQELMDTPRWINAPSGTKFIFKDSQGRTLSTTKP